jgi:hypothetical protein
VTHGIPVPVTLSHVPPGMDCSFSEAIYGSKQTQKIPGNAWVAKAPELGIIYVSGAV